MGDTITVYRVEESPVELLPEKIFFTDRTRMEVGVCPEKRYLEYELGGMGVVPSGRNDHLRLGSAVHEGIDLLLQGGTLEKALHVAELDYCAPPLWPDSWPEDQRAAILYDGLHLVKAFVYAFEKYHLPYLLDEYEVLEVEEEINWLLLADFDENPEGGIVVMSRPDAVLRKKSNGRLWHMSHKTSGQKFDDKQMDKLRVDIQRLSEGFAIWAKYGEPIEGSLYNYFLKGTRQSDEDLDVERYTSGLIHPYLNRLALGESEITPEYLSFSYEWQELEEETMKVKKRRLGKGWEKVDIYNEMDYMTYLDWLSKQLVPRQGRNYLVEAIAGMVPIEWNTNHAERWRIGKAQKEREWSWKMEHLREVGEELKLYAHAQEIPLEEKECFSYNAKCTFYDHCHKDVPIATLVEQGRLTERYPNHLVELRKRQ